MIVKLFRSFLAGKDADEVRRVTGWFKGMEGKPRFEIDDSAMVWGPKSQTIEKAISEIMDSKDGLPVVKDFIKHDALFSQYPEIADVRVSALPKSMMGGTTASFDGSTITVRADLSPDQFKDSVTHEIQHCIQQKEGFARGGSPDLGVTPEALKILDEMKKPLVEELRRAKEAGDWARADDLQKKIMMDAVSRSPRSSIRMW